jgi:RNA polymerase sigma factor (TIGR02999 family)
MTPPMDPQPPPLEITSLLHRARAGDKEALDRLFPLVYSELHRLAASEMRRDFSNVTLQPTALINEAILRIFGDAVPDFHDRAHFLGIVSRVMRQVLVDYARARRAQKRGPGLQIPLDDSTPAPQDHADLLAIDEAMNRFAAEDPHLVTLIEMRFFAGMTAEETAAALNRSVHVVRHEIRYALAWLRRALDPARES